MSDKMNGWGKVTAIVSVVGLVLAMVGMGMSVSNKLAGLEVEVRETNRRLQVIEDRIFVRRER